MEPMLDLSLIKVGPALQTMGKHGLNVYVTDMRPPLSFGVFTLSESDEVGNSADRANMNS